MTYVRHVISDVSKGNRWILSWGNLRAKHLSISLSLYWNSLWYNQLKFRFKLRFLIANMLSPSIESKFNLVYTFAVLGPKSIFDIETTSHMHTQLHCHAHSHMHIHTQTRSHGHSTQSRSSNQSQANTVCVFVYKYLRASMYYYAI